MMKHTFTVGQKLTEFFTDLYGSINCKDIQAKIMGRSFDLNAKDELEAFDAAGGHDIHCPTVVKNGTQKIMELLLNEGLVSE